MEERFTYDHLNRLTGIWLNNSRTGWMDYDPYGRMTGKTIDNLRVFSDAIYNTTPKPHAIDQADVDQGSFFEHSLTYTCFDKVKTIAQGSNTLEYTYGYDRQRIFMEEHANGEERTKRYVGNCEFVAVTENNVTTEKTLTYLTGPMGVFAVVEQQGNDESLHYILKDHLGSWTTITDAEGVVEQELSFDAWGTRRNPETWHSSSQLPEPMFDRGFTGHEHLYAFGLINMNGRMYDPFTSGFLSVDNYVQSPDYTQSFNRYAYCLNNPLKYTDPDGEFAILDAWLNGFVFGFFSSSENRLSNAVKRANQLAKNDAKIWAGLASTDSNNSFWERNWEVFSRLTWQSPQVFTGLGWSLAKNFVGVVDRVEYFDDATYVINENWKKNGIQGVGIGNYINIDMKETIPNETSFSGFVLNTDKLMHEYGHTIQSKRWGPLYLLSIGIPSLISGAMNGVNHNHRRFYTEVLANRRAKEHFSELYGINWNSDQYPIEWEDNP